MDKKAKSILFKTYWTSQGWKHEFETDPTDFDYAKSKGLMFDTISMSMKKGFLLILFISYLNAVYGQTGTLLTRFGSFTDNQVKRSDFIKVWQKCEGSRACDAWKFAVERC